MKTQETKSHERKLDVAYKIDCIKSALPDHYEVKESKEKGNVHCKSSTGISNEDEWEGFMNYLHTFPDFLEAYHNTCHNHIDFTIYFK